MNRSDTVLVYLALKECLRSRNPVDNVLTTVAITFGIDDEEAWVLCDRFAFDLETGKCIVPDLLDDWLKNRLRLDDQERTIGLVSLTASSPGGNHETNRGHCSDIPTDGGRRFRACRNSEM